MRFTKSMLDVSSSAANLLYNISNVGLIIGAVLVLGSTIGTVWMGAVKERYSDERIAANETATATANEGAARANERAASLEREAAQARLEQERIRQQNLSLETELAKLTPRVQRLEPKSLSVEQVDKLVSILASNTSSIEIAQDMGSSEIKNLAGQLVNAFAAASWRVSSRQVLGPRGVMPSSGLRLTLANPINPSLSESTIMNAFREAQILYDLSSEPYQNRIPEGTQFVAGLLVTAPIR